jgi:hypothetical protein
MKDQDNLSSPDIQAMADVLGTGNQKLVDVIPQIAIAGDDGVYAGWQDLVAGTVRGRYFKTRLLLLSYSPNTTPLVEEFTWSVDVPDLIQKNQEVLSAATKTIVFPKKFNTIPNIQTTQIGASVGDKVVVGSVTTEGMTLEIRNSSNALKAGSVDWLAQGY